MRRARLVAIGAGVYFAVVVVVAIATPRGVTHINEPQCFDDWCITVTGARWSAPAPDDHYEVTLRLSSRARRRPMGEKGTVVYLTDAQGRRYDPLPESGDVPFDTLLQPGQAVDTRRRFAVPREAADLGLVYTHEGGFPIGWFIVGEGGWFQKPPIVPLT
jgi:hypothetical protein